MRSRNTVRLKLLRATVGIWIVVTLAMLGAVAFGQVRSTQESMRRIELYFRDHQREKGRLLTTNQVLALRAMAVDNAFSDVRQLVRQTAQEDADIIYGTFTDARGAPWVSVTPNSASANDETETPALPPDLPPLGPREPSRTPQNRTLSAFGSLIEEHSADVWDGSDHLGSIRYGFSTARTEFALQQSRDIARRQQLRLLGLLSVFGIAGIALGVVAIRRIAHRITQPLAELTRASEELGRGNRAVRAEVASGDELEQLALTFNAMANANELAMRELEVKTTEALESSRLKSEFLANMSHEIRTPMNGILGVVRLVNKLPLEGKLRRYMETIDASASALLTIINDVLDFSKMEAGKYTLRSVSFDLRAVVQDVCELLANRAHDKGIELVCRVDPQIRSTYLGDPDRLRQIVSNLLGNAIKFTDRGEIFVNAGVQAQDSQRETIQISVVDTGIGIAESDLTKLFDAFSQLDGSMMRKYGGTGLGLAISKRLVELMGGTIGVKSVLGSGSEFHFQVAFEVDSNVSANWGTWAAGKRAVVVESNQRWMTVVREHLETWGMSAVGFGLAEDFFAQLRDDHTAYDIAVVSTQLKDLEFDEFVRRLRSRTAGKDLPIIALYQLGAGAFVREIETELAAQLSKPLRLSELYNTLQIALGGDKPASGRMLSATGIPISVLGKVLVVDDNEINRFVAAEMLEQMGYIVEVAENGAEAVELVKQNEYLVVLMDCQMPVMDGYSATREIRRLEARIGRHQPIIALTAHALSGERGRVLEAGMDDYLSKPVRPSSLDKMIHRYARSRAKLGPKSRVASSGVNDSTLDPSISRSNKLIELFLKNIPGQLAAIDEAVQRGSLTDLRSQAHKTKGSCLALGAITMARTAELLQKAGETGESAGATGLVSELRAQYDAVVIQLERELGRELEDG